MVGGGEMRARGFTLVELLVTMVIALIVVGGLMASFQSQYGHYKFQSRKGDAVQDMEAVLRLLDYDLKNTLIVAGAPTIQLIPDPYANPASATTDLYTQVWEPDVAFWNNNAALQAQNNYRAQRHWRYDAQAQSLKLDRNTRDGSDNPSEALRDVTWFQVWQGMPPPGIADAPPSDPYGMALVDETGAAVTSPLYTVLIEMRVPVGYRGGVKRDVFGNATNEPRIHRYLQVHPMIAVSQ